MRGTGEILVGNLSSDVFERRTSTGSEPFPLLISLDATIFVLPSVLILIETICPKICSKSRLKSAKRPLPVDVRRSKTSLLKLPIVCELIYSWSLHSSISLYYQSLKNIEFSPIQKIIMGNYVNAWEDRKCKLPLLSSRVWILDLCFGFHKSKDTLC